MFAIMAAKKLLSKRDANFIRHFHVYFRRGPPKIDGKTNLSCIIVVYSNFDDMTFAQIEFSNYWNCQLVKIKSELIVQYWVTLTTQLRWLFVCPIVICGKFTLTQTGKFVIEISWLIISHNAQCTDMQNMCYSYRQTPRYEEISMCT